MLPLCHLPLKDRVLHGHGSQIRHQTCSRRPEKLKSWTSSGMAKALDAIQNQRYTYRRAEEEFGIPSSTLHDHVSGRVHSGQGSGPPKYLTDEEEEELEEFLIGCASVGFAKTRQQVLALVQDVVSRKGRAAQVTHGWWESFKRRHPQLTLRTASPLSYARAVASNPEVIHRYFDLLEQTILENGLANKPSQIFNLDETGMPLDPKPLSVVAKKGQKHPSAVGSGDKS